MTDKKPQPGDDDFELPRKEIPKGLENNAAFREYMGLSRKQREQLKTSGIEMPDVERLANKDEQIDALKGVIRSQLEVIGDQRRQLGNFKGTFQQIAAINVQVAHDEIDPAAALRQITGLLLTASGIDPNTQPQSTETH